MKNAQWAGAKDKDEMKGGAGGVNAEAKGDAKADGEKKEKYWYNLWD